MIREVVIDFIKSKWPRSYTNIHNNVIIVELPDDSMTLLLDDTCVRSLSHVNGIVEYSDPSFFDKLLLLIYE